MIEQMIGLRMDTVTMTSLADRLNAQKLDDSKSAFRRQISNLRNDSFEVSTDALSQGTWNQENNGLHSVTGRFIPAEEAFPLSPSPVDSFPLSTISLNRMHLSHNSNAMLVTDKTSFFRQDTPSLLAPSPHHSFHRQSFLDQSMHDKTMSGVLVDRSNHQVRYLDGARSFLDEEVSRLLTDVEPPPLPPPPPPPPGALTLSATRQRSRCGANRVYSMGGDKDRKPVAVNLLRQCPHQATFTQRPCLDFDKMQKTSFRQFRRSHRDKGQKGQKGQPRIAITKDLERTLLEGRSQIVCRSSFTFRPLSLKQGLGAILCDKRISHTSSNKKTRTPNPNS